MALSGTYGAYPSFTVTFAPSRTPVVGKLRFRSKVNGGHDTLEGIISEAERAASPGSYAAGNKMKVTIAAGQTGAGAVTFDGYVAETVRASRTNECVVKGIGAAETARRAFRTRLYRTDDYGLWGGRNSEDSNVNPNHEGMDATTDGRLLYSVAPRGAYGIGNSAGVTIVVEEAKVRRVTVINGKSTDRPDWAFRGRVFTAPLAGGDESLMTMVGSLVPLGSNGPAQGATITWTVPAGQERNAFNIDLYHVNGNGIAEGNDFRTGLNTVRVYDVATVDTYYASNVVTDIGTLLGWDTSLVQALSTNKVLPIYWKRDASLDGLLDDMCVMDQLFWRVRERAATDKFKLELSSWTNAASVVWYINPSDVAENRSVVEIENGDDLFNQARVYYRTLSGRLKHVTVNADGLNGRPVDPYAGTDWAFARNPLAFDDAIPDRQPDGVLATAWANALVKEYATPMPQGTVTLATAHVGSITGTEKFAPLILAGDRLNVFGTTYRIYEAEHSDEGPTRLTIGRRPGIYQAVVAKHMKRLERRGQAA